MKIYKQIPLVMADVGAIGKNGTNTHDNYKFRSIDDVYNKLQPALAKYGVFFAPTVLESKEEKVHSAKGAEMNRVKIKVRYMVFADDGSSFETTVEGEAIDRGDKATNKALTAAFKYMLIQVFCIAVVGQEDADAESHDVVAKPGRPNPLESLREETARVVEFPGEYICTFGKFKGQRIKDIDPFELGNYLEFIRDSSKKQNKPIVNGVLAFLDSAEAYLKTLEFERA